MSGAAGERWTGGETHPSPKALELLSDVPGYVWDGERLPVPIEEIADSHLGLLVRETTNLGD
jgi:hypothetical protein